jgi:hypothetical protein
MNGSLALGSLGTVMRYALTTLACALVVGLAVLMVGGGSRVPDPPPVELVDDARTSRTAGKPAGASHEPGRRDQGQARTPRER